MQPQGWHSHLTHSPGFASAPDTGGSRDTNEASPARAAVHNHIKAYTAATTAATLNLASSIKARNWEKTYLYKGHEHSPWKCDEQSLWAFVD